MSSFYEQFFAEPMPERQRIAEAAGLSLAYIHKHTYVQQREPRFHFHNAVGLDRASNGKLCLLDITEGEVDWEYVLQRLKALQKAGRIGRKKIKPLPTTHFEAFWALYPRKVNKAGAARAWHGQDCDAFVSQIKVDLQKRIASEDWTKDNGRFIPHPTTYLNQRRWEEVFVIAANPQGAFAGAL